MNSQTTHRGGHARRVIHFAIFAAMLACAFHLSAARVSAQSHTVFVEGNCDSPVPGANIVGTGGVCGDFDGDGRVGSAEDTDGADRIFGTINAALSSGTGAAAGTGINHNGRVVIVTSGRFYESVFIGRTQCVGCPGSANPGNVTLEAAPGVDAVIDAVFQGDPTGGNDARRASTGIAVAYLANTNMGLTRMVVLRNLTVRNFARGAEIAHNARVLIDNCRFENNLNYGILLNFGSLAVINNTQVSGTGFRTSGVTTSSPGHGISLESNAQAKIVNSVSAHNLSAGVFNSGGAANLTLFKVGLYFNGTDILGPFTATLEPNYSTTN